MPTVAISNRTIVAGCLFLLAVATVVALREVVVLVFVAIVLATAINPTVATLEGWGVTRRWGIALVLLGAAAVVFVLTITVVPLVVAQFSDFVAALPQMLNRVPVGSGLATVIQRLTTSGNASIAGIFSRLGAGIFQGTLGLFSGLLSLVAFVALIYYFSIEERSLRATVLTVVPSRFRPVVETVVREIEQRLGHWLRGQLVLGLIIGTAVTIGLLLLHVKYALALGLIAGVTELVPTIGPYLGMVPAILVGFSQSPLMAVWVFVLYWAVQQSENNFLVPRIMSRATGLNPIVVLIGILVGAKLAGILGIILSVPVIIILSSLASALLTERQGATA